MKQYRKKDKKMQEEQIVYWGSKLCSPALFITHHMYTDSENCEFSSHQKRDLSRCSQIVQWVLQKGMQIIKSMIVSYSGSQAVPFCWLSCVSMCLQKLWRGMGHPEVLCSWSALWAYTFCLDWAAQTLHSVQCPLGCVGLLLAPAHLAHWPFPVGK